MGGVLTVKTVKCSKCGVDEEVHNDQLKDEVYIICFCGHIDVIDFRLVNEGK